MVKALALLADEPGSISVTPWGILNPPGVSAEPRVIPEENLV